MAGLVRMRRSGGAVRGGCLRGRLGWLAGGFCLCTGCVPDDFGSGLRDDDEDGFFGGEAKGQDCDDGDPMVNPDQVEVCDGRLVDNDCDGLPDGALLPWGDVFSNGLDDAWLRVLGSAPTQRANGVQVEDPPLALSLHTGAECWGGTSDYSGYRLAAGWLPHEEDAPFELQLVLMSGPEWGIGRGRPQDGYLVQWSRSGEEDGAFQLWRLNDGLETVIGYAGWQPRAEDWAAFPYIFVEVRVDHTGTHLSVHAPGIGHNDVMARTDSAEDRHTVGGIGVGVLSSDGPGVLTGVFLDPL